MQGSVQSVTGVSQPSGALYIGQSYTVEATLSGALSTGQGVYWAYYNYAVLDYYLANTDGNWSAPSTWANGAVPPSGANVAIDAAVTVDVAPACTNVELFSEAVNMGASQLSCERLILNSGTTFNLSSGSLTCKYLTITAGGAFDAGSGVLTVTTGGRIQTTGSFNAGSGKVVFAGTGELSGAITFNNVDIHNGVDFRTSHSGTIGVAVINGTLSIKSGGYVSAAYPPKYGSNSTLEYNTGGNYFAANEWNSSWFLSVGNLLGIKHGFGLLHNTFPIFARFFTNSSFASQVIINLFCINVCTNNCFLRSTSFSL